MLYLNQPILQTDADVIVVPTQCDEEIPEGSLHEAMVAILPAVYLSRHFTAIRQDRIHPGHPWIYYIQDGEPEWVGKWIISLPVQRGMTFQCLIEGVRRCMAMVKEMSADAVAVPMPLVEFGWDTTVQELMWQWCEREQYQAARKDNSIAPEVWFYTGEEHLVERNDTVLDAARELAAVVAEGEQD